MGNFNLGFSINFENSNSDLLHFQFLKRKEKGKEREGEKKTILLHSSASWWDNNWTQKPYCAHTN